MTDLRELPGIWQDNMVERLLRVGYSGFTFGPGVQWSFMRGKMSVAGPFHSRDEVDAWLTDAEQSVEAGQYRCENCLGVFKMDRSDDEARAEFFAKYPGASIDDAALLCDPCATKVNAWIDEAPRNGP